MYRVFTRVLGLATGLLSFAASADAQAGPPPQVRATIEAIEQAFDSKSDSLITALVAERFTASYRASGGASAHVARIKALRAKLGGLFAGADLERDDEGLVLTLNGAAELRLRVVLDEQGLISRLVEQPSTEGRRQLEHAGMAFAVLP